MFTPADPEFSKTLAFSLILLMIQNSPERLYVAIGKQSLKVLVELLHRELRLADSYNRSYGDENEAMVIFGANNYLKIAKLE